MSLGGYQAGPVWMRALRYVIGLIGVLILMGLGEISPRGDGPCYSLRFVRYALVV